MSDKKEIRNSKKVKPKINFFSRKILLPVSIVLILLVVIFWFLFFFYGYISVDDAYIDRDKITISSKQLGRISNILVGEGDAVKKDQLLVELDKDDLIAQKSQAEASASYMEQNIVLTNINYEKAKDDYNRNVSLYRNHNISQQDYMHSKSAYESAEASYNMALKQLDVSKAQVELYKIHIEEASIYSKVDGIVAKKWAFEGDVVQPSQPILSVNSNEKVWVIANLQETDLMHVHINDAVDISVDAYKNMKFKGRIFQIGANTASQFALIPSENASGNFTKVTQRIPVKISIEPKKSGEKFDYNFLLPGLSVVVKIKK